MCLARSQEVSAPIEARGVVEESILGVLPRYVLNQFEIRHVERTLCALRWKVRPCH